MAASSPLKSLSLSAQNTKRPTTPSKISDMSLELSENQHTNGSSPANLEDTKMVAMTPQAVPESDDNNETTPKEANTPLISPIKSIQDSPLATPPQRPLLAGNVTSDCPTDSTETSPLEQGSPGDQPTSQKKPMSPKTIDDVDNTQLPENNEGMSTILPKEPSKDEEEDDIVADITLDVNDTINDISTFSEIPDVDLTRFANLRKSTAASASPAAQISSPSKRDQHSAAPTPSTTRRQLRLGQYESGVDRHAATDDEEDDGATPRCPRDASPSENLLNFTGQSHMFVAPPPPFHSRNGLRRSHSGRGGFPIKVNPSPTHRSQASLDRESSRVGASATTSPVKAGRTGRASMLASTALPTTNTPVASRRTSHLLDFDLEPLATPRSIPTITPRELESLRSDLSSQISSLSASLSGKEAEVLALKRAITDAEVRVGNTSEELRNERLLRETLAQEKHDWERRGQEMEAVLREIRQEIMVGEHERDKLRKQAEDAEKKTDEMEVRVVELRTRLDSAHRRATMSPHSSSTSPNKESGQVHDQPSTPLLSGRDNSALAGLDINEAVREATERVAKDLHGLYRSKHETKVAALKKSYEARWEKRVRHLESDLRHAREEITSLKQSSSNNEGVALNAEKAKTAVEELEHAEAEKKILLARLQGMESEIDSVRQESSGLRDQVEKERVEKGELVAQVDLFLALGDGDHTQQQQPQSPPQPQRQHQQQQQQQQQQPAPPTGRTPGAIDRHKAALRTGLKRNSTAMGPEPRMRSVSSDSVVNTDGVNGNAHHNAGLLSSPRNNLSKANGVGVKPTLSSHTRPTPHFSPSRPGVVGRRTTATAGATSSAASTTSAVVSSSSSSSSTTSSTSSSSAVSSLKPRPTSMLQQPGKFSGIPGPGFGAVRPGSGTAGVGIGSGSGGGILEGIARMGAGGTGVGAGR